jgi:L-malate glycosyltransferase
MISQRAIEDHKKQYNNWGIPAILFQNILYIPNGIPLPEKSIPKTHDGELKLLYVGRGTPEKRPHIAALVGHLATNQGVKNELTFLGDVKEGIPSYLQSAGKQLGNISDQAIIDKIYNSNHCLILTSSTEGFPLVVMEAMARGLSIIATDVGDISIHVKDGKNGFIIKELKDETQIAAEALRYVKLLQAEPDLLLKQSGNNIEYAQQNFGIQRFNQQYSDLFSTYS